MFETSMLEVPAKEPSQELNVSLLAPSGVRKSKTRSMKAQAQTIVTGVLGDARTSGCTLDVKVLEEDILYHAPGRYF